MVNTESNNGLDILLKGIYRKIQAHVQAHTEKCDNKMCLSPVSAVQADCWPLPSPSGTGPQAPAV